MHPMWPLLPELDYVRLQPVAAPPFRARQLLWELGSLLLPLALQPLTAGYYLALGRRPGLYLALPWPALEVGIRFFRRDAFD